MRVSDVIPIVINDAGTRLMLFIRSKCTMYNPNISKEKESKRVNGKAGRAHSRGEKAEEHRGVKEKKPRKTELLGLYTNQIVELSAEFSLWENCIASRNSGASMIWQVYIMTTYSE